MKRIHRHAPRHLPRRSAVIALHEWNSPSRSSAWTACAPLAGTVSASSAFSAATCIHPGGQPQPRRRDDRRPAQPPRPSMSMPESSSAAAAGAELAHGDRRPSDGDQPGACASPGRSSAAIRVRPRPRRRLRLPDTPAHIRARGQLVRRGPRLHQRHFLGSQRLTAPVAVEAGTVLTYRQDCRRVEELTTQRMKIALDYAARSDVGLVRSENQDSGYAGPTSSWSPTAWEATPEVTSPAPSPSAPW